MTTRQERRASKLEKRKSRMRVHGLRYVRTMVEITKKEAEHVRADSPSRSRRSRHR